MLQHPCTKVDAQGGDSTLPADCPVFAFPSESNPFRSLDKECFFLLLYVTSSESVSDSRFNFGQHSILEKDNTSLDGDGDHACDSHCIPSYTAAVHPHLMYNTGSHAKSKSAQTFKTLRTIPTCTSSLYKSNWKLPEDYEDWCEGPCCLCVYFPGVCEYFRPRCGKYWRFCTQFEDRYSECTMQVTPLRHQ